MPSGPLGRLWFLRLLLVRRGQICARGRVVLWCVTIRTTHILPQPDLRTRPPHAQLSHQPVNVETCVGGTYSSKGAASCALCLAGWYSYGGASACTICDSGKHSAADGASTCDTCASGRFSSAGLANCTRCTAGSFSNSGSSECSKCASGYYSEVASAVCTKCDSGSFSNESSAACVPCPSGHWSGSGQADACIPCDKVRSCLAMPTRMRPMAIYSYKATLPSFKNNYTCPSSRILPLHAEGHVLTLGCIDL